MQAFKGIDETCAVFKTNPRLTGNVKLVVKSNSNIVLTQLNDANKESAQLPYSSTLNYATNIATFLQSYVKGNKFQADGFDLNSANVLHSKTYEQFDQQYQYGAKYSLHHGKHRFFAPLWITDKKMPKFFVIVARPKLATNYGKRASLYDSMQWQVVKTYDLANGVVGKIYNNITSFEMFRNEPMTFNVQNATVYGISISKKLQTVATISTKQLQETEYTLLEADNYLTNVFRDSGMVIQNLINFEYEFELPNNSMYEVAGYYVDDINNINIDDDFVQSVYANNNISVLRNSMTLTKRYNEVSKAYELEQFDQGKTYPTSYETLMRKFVTPTVRLTPRILNRFTQFEVRRSVAIGDYLAIVECDRVTTIYCDLVRNDSAFFKFSDDITKQMENLNDALQRADTKYLYVAEYNAKQQQITLECRNWEAADAIQLYVDAPDAFWPLIKASTLVANHAQKYRYEFSAFSTFKNTLVISNVSTSLAGIDIGKVDFVTLSIDGGEPKRTHIKNVLYDYDNNQVFLIFTDDFDFDQKTLATKIILALYDVRNIEIAQMQFYDIVYFDYMMSAYDVKSKHNIQFNLIQLQTQYPEIVDAVYAQFPEGSDLPFIKNVTPGAIEYSGNPYDLFKEYDQQTLALFNKVNIATNRWVSSKGLNCYNLPMVANTSLAYNQANISPVLDSDKFHDIHSLQYEYFVIGKKPSDPEMLDFATDDLTLAMLHENNAIRKYFEHQTTKVIAEIKFANSLPNYTETFTKPKVKDKCFAIFKGVEYELPYIYRGYKFTVVHIANSNYLTPKITEVINKQDKSYIIAIEFPIVDSILTGVEWSPVIFADPDLKMHRYIYYTNINEVNTAANLEGSGITADVKIDSVVIGRKAQRNFSGGITVNDFKVISNGTPYFAIDFSSIQNTKDIFKEFTSCQFTDDSGYVVTFSNIINVQDSYIWVENINDTEGFNLATEYAQSGDNLGNNQKVNVVMNKMAGIILKSTNFNTTSSRYYPIAFTNFVRQINASNYEAKVTKPKNIIVMDYLEPIASGLSHAIQAKDIMSSYVLQRYVINATPSAYSALSPMTIIRDSTIDRANTDFVVESTERLTLPQAAQKLPNFGIYKLGDAETLTTDDIGSTDIPRHTQIGETVYSLISDYGLDYSPLADGLRFYVHRNQSRKLPATECLVNHASGVSTLLNFNVDFVEQRLFNVDFVELNVREIVAFNLQKKFGYFTTEAYLTFAEYMLSRYTYKVEFYDFEDRKVDPVLSADYVQSDIYVQRYNFANVGNYIAKIAFG
ncbi:hypothetical protein MA9V2_067 [Chryseobacterium phage MA9V-2]|nr:hypothetical protein MA9V2_067 [Chryseobacterium phage MA9V-2]